MKKIAFLMPGQGSQYVGMGKKLYEKFSIARRLFEESSSTLNLDMKKLCFEGDLRELTKTENAQPAILTVSTIAYKIYTEELGMKAEYLVGHSLGEITALTCAGMIAFEDALQLVRKRGLLMSKAQDGTMAAIRGICLENITETINEVYREDKKVYIANYNSPNQIVISGHANAVEEVVDKLARLEEGSASPLKVSGAFHTSLMQRASDEFRDELNKYSFGECEIPVIANINALPYKDNKDIIDNLTEQIIRPVKWSESMRFLKEEGVDFVIDVGPGSIFKKLAAYDFDMEAFSFDSPKDVTALQELFGKEKNLKPISLVTRALGVAVSTKNENFNDSEYNKGVVVPYKAIEKMNQAIENENRNPTKEEKIKAVKLLKVILSTKKLSPIEQEKRLHSLLYETNSKDLLSYI